MLEIHKVFLKAMNRARKQAIDIAARTGTKLVFYKDGKIVLVSPPYKYIKVPIKPKPKK